MSRLKNRTAKNLENFSKTGFQKETCRMPTTQSQVPNFRYVKEQVKASQTRKFGREQVLALLASAHVKIELFQTPTDLAPGEHQRIEAGSRRLCCTYFE